jgi:hypothetical protein
MEIKDITEFPNGRKKNRRAQNTMYAPMMMEGGHVNLVRD